MNLLETRRHPMTVFQRHPRCLLLKLGVHQNTALSPACFAPLSRKSAFLIVPAGSPSRGGDVAVYVLDIHQPSLPTPFFYSVLLSVSVFMALSTVIP